MAPSFTGRRCMPIRKWTPEQRKAASERAKARMAVQAVAEPEPELAEDDPLGDLIAALGKARNKKASTAKDLEELGAILDRIDPKANPELADDPTIEAFLDKIGQARLKKAEQTGLAPGTVIGTGMAERDVPWKLADVNLLPDGSKELVTWTPNETIPVFYNGVMCQCIADVPMTTEKAFMDVYLEHKRLVQVANEHRQYMFGRSSQLPRELQTTDAAVSTARIRAFMAAGGEYGGGRITMGYPGDSTFELRDVPGGGAVSGETPTQ